MDKNAVFELVASAKINLDNMAKMIPGLKSHPMFLIVTAQLDEAEQALKE